MKPSTWPVWALLLVGSGCSSGSGSDSDTSSKSGPEPADEPVDADGDGFDTTVDCDDKNPRVSPGAFEGCDDLDNDCDGEIDEDALDAEVWYLDSDGDGYGDPRAEVLACTQPADAVPLAEATDCYDDDAGAHPGADEICDGIDNDCDGYVDLYAVDRLEWFKDSDGDGFGDPDRSAESCVQLTGHVDNNQDCDDTDDTVYPRMQYPDLDQDGFGANDGVLICELIVGYLTDNSDCDDTNPDLYPNSAESCLWIGDWPLSRADMTLTTTSLVQLPLGGVGDLNGDGFDDAMVGSPMPDGSAYVVYGGPEIGAGDVSSASLPSINSTSVGSKLGVSAAGAGDIDGDGFDDVIIGAGDAAEGRGAVYLFHGPVSGAMDDTDAAGSLLGEADGDLLGNTLAAVGDLSGDGVVDLIIAAQGHDSDRGRAYLVSGAISSSGASIGDVAFALIEGAGSDGTGIGIGGGDDLNGDGVADVIIGEYEDDRAAVFYGPFSGDLRLHTADVLVEGNDYTGMDVATAPDLDGDGYGDFLIGSPRDGLGTVSLFSGSTSGSVTLADADVQLSGAEGSQAHFGGKFDIIDDIDQDGLPEVLVSTGYVLYGPGYIAYGAGDGNAYLYHSGGALRDWSSATIELSGADVTFVDDDLKGTTVATGAGDLDGDGTGDVMLWQLDDTPSVYVFFGESY